MHARMDLYWAQFDTADLLSWQGIETDCVTDEQMETETETIGAYIEPVDYMKLYGLSTKDFM